MPSPDQLTSLPDLPCPECRMNGATGKTRIGNNRSTCGTCNRFYQRVMRMSRNRLIAQHQADYEKIRIVVERDLYPLILDQHELNFPGIAGVEL